MDKFKEQNLSTQLIFGARPNITAIFVPQCGGKGFNRHKTNLPTILTGWMCVFFEEMFENREDGIEDNTSEIQVTICYDNVIRAKLYLKSFAVGTELMLPIFIRTTGLTHLSLFFVIMHNR